MDVWGLENDTYALMKLASGKKIVVLSAWEQKSQNNE